MLSTEFLLCTVSVLVPLTISGCGGGGGDSPSPGPPGPGPPLPPTPKPWQPFNCDGQAPEPLSLIAGAKKGLAVDDTTFLNCSDRILSQWPFTSEKVKTLRLFKPWGHGWSEDEREGAWNNIKGFVDANDAKVLVGTQITCNEADDDAEWKLMKAFLTKLGPDHIMAVAIGNEMDLLWSQVNNSGWPDFHSECNDFVWQQGYYSRKTVERITELDSMGFSQVRVTAVWGGFSLSGDNKCCYHDNNCADQSSCADDPWCSASKDNCEGACQGHLCMVTPFHDSPFAYVNTYLKKMHDLYGKRWAFTFNFYPYFDGSNKLDEGTTDQCKGAIAQSTCFGSNCLIADILKATRVKLQQLTGNSDDSLWLGEAGWSTPVASTLKKINKDMAACPDFSSRHTFNKFYEQFLAWDLSVSSPQESIPGVDHVFYFTAHDSVTFGHDEHFGLVGTCEDAKCKQQFDSVANTVV